MKLLLTAVALAIASPALAQAAPAQPGHSAHAGHDMAGHEGHDMKGCCETDAEGKMACCEKMKAAGKTMACCGEEKAKATTPAPDAHGDHQH